MKTWWWMQLLVLSCLAGVSIQASIKHNTDASTKYQQFLQDFEITDEEFKLHAADKTYILNKVKQSLKKIQPKTGERFSADQPEDVDMMTSHSPLIGYDTPELIRYYGYPVETHYVTTDDGYNLVIHRIPFGKTGAEPGVNREPIILQHGLLCSSADWVMNPPEQGFGYLLADAGYDVWLPNIRGNTYSKTNDHLSNKDQEFWQFSWNKMGVYDMPSVIDYILDHTGFSQLYYAGHSMGTTMVFVMMDQHPEYNDKIRAFFALAPVATLDNMRSPVRLIVPYIRSLEWLSDFLEIYEFFPSNDLMEFVASFFCEDDDFTQFICSNIIFLLSGYNKEQLNTTMLPIYISHTPAGTSSKTLVHYGQDSKSGIFRQYDHGRRGNIDWYGSTVPPLYDLSKTTVDTYFYWGENDWMTAPEDVMEAAEYIPNLKLSYRVDDDHFAHLDFVWAIQANSLLYEKIIDQLSGMHIDVKPTATQTELLDNVDDINKV